MRQARTFKKLLLVTAFQVGSYSPVVMGTMETTARPEPMPTSLPNLR